MSRQEVVHPDSGRQVLQALLRLHPVQQQYIVVRVMEAKKATREAYKVEMQANGGGPKPIIGGERWKKNDWRKRSEQRLWSGEAQRRVNPISYSYGFGNVFSNRAYYNEQNFLS